MMKMKIPGSAEQQKRNDFSDKTPLRKTQLRKGQSSGKSLHLYTYQKKKTTVLSAKSLI